MIEVTGVFVWSCSKCFLTRIRRSDVTKAYGFNEARSLCLNRTFAKFDSRSLHVKYTVVKKNTLAADLSFKDFQS